MEARARKALVSADDASAMMKPKNLKEMIGRLLGTENEVGCSSSYSNNSVHRWNAMLRLRQPRRSRAQCLPPLARPCDGYGREAGQ